MEREPISTRVSIDAEKEPDCNQNACTLGRFTARGDLTFVSRDQRVTFRRARALIDALCESTGSPEVCSGDFVWCLRSHTLTFSLATQASHIILCDTLARFLQSLWSYRYLLHQNTIRYPSILQPKSGPMSVRGRFPLESSSAVCDWRVQCLVRGLRSSSYKLAARCHVVPGGSVWCFGRCVQRCLG